MTQNAPVADLLAAVSEFLEDSQSTKYGSRDLLALSIQCSSHWREAVACLGKALAEKFGAELDVITKRLQIYANPVFSFDASTSFTDIVSQAYRGTPGLPGDCKDFTSACLASVATVSILRKTIDTQAEIVSRLSACCLPLNRKVYFLDERVNRFEHIFLKLHHRLIRKNMRSVIALMKYCMLVRTRMTDTEEYRFFSDDMKHVFAMFKKLGLKRKILKSVEPLLIEQGISDLENLRSDFNAVVEYFASRMPAFSAAFSRRIERYVLSSLYSAITPEAIAKSLESTELCASIYTIFQGRELKEKLKTAFALLLPDKITANSFVWFADRCKLIQEILKIFKDRKFEGQYTSYFEHILTSPANCNEIAAFLNNIFASGEPYSADSETCIFTLISSLIDASINPETFLNELRSKLALRLLKYRLGLISGTLPADEVQERLKRELTFLTKPRKMYSENMLRMVDDMQTFLTHRRENTSSALLMTMCKWPVFRTEEVKLAGEDAVSKYKLEVSNRLNADKKTVTWIDSLSVIRVEIFAKVITLSLFQYSLLLRLIEGGAVVDKEIFDKRSRFSTLCLKNLDRRVSPMYRHQFEALLDDLVVVKGNLYVLNPFFSKLDYIRFPVEFQSLTLSESIDATYSVQACNEAKVTRLIKRMKSACFAEMLTNLEGVTEDELRDALARLQEKEIVEIHEDKISYCP